MTKLYLGIDLGGTEVKLAIVDEKGTIVEESRIPNNLSSLPKEICQEIIAHARTMKDFSNLSGTGIGVAGDIDQEKGIVRFSPNLPGWKNTNLRKILGTALPHPIIVDNDANVAALGAYWLEAKGKLKNLVCITLGTGVGGGIICDGRLYRGTSGSAGEIGHMHYQPDGLLCNCGSRGCIESYVGANALSVHAKNEVKAGKSKVISTLVNNKLDKITPEIIAKAANMGDHLAKKIWDEAGEKLGVVIAGIINFMNPEMVILCGGISKAGDLLLDPIKETVKKRTFLTPAKVCKIVVSKYTQKLGVVGAALLAKS